MQESQMSKLKVQSVQYKGSNSAIQDVNDKSSHSELDLAIPFWHSALPQKDLIDSVEIRT